jgi:hypothetical protein
VGSDSEEGSEADVAIGGRERIADGRRNRLGFVDDDGWCSSVVEGTAGRGGAVGNAISDVLRTQGEASGPSLSVSSPLSSWTTPITSFSSSSSSSSSSKIFAKSSPTFGVLTNNFASSAGVGVAKGSPVMVNTTPFIADGSKLKALGGLRLTGVSKGDGRW